MLLVLVKYILKANFFFNPKYKWLLTELLYIALSTNSQFNNVGTIVLSRPKGQGSLLCLGSEFVNTLCLKNFQHTFENEIILYAY